MTSVLLTIHGAVMNLLAFSGPNFFFSKLTNHGKNERKRHDLALEKLQGVRDKRNEVRTKWFNFINKRLLEKTKQKHTSTMSRKQCFSNIEYLQNK